MNALLHLLRTHWRLLLLVLIVLLLLPVVVASVIAAEEASGPALAPAESAESAEAISVPATEPGGGPLPLAEYREMLERPLFSSTRRPPLLRDAPQENLDAQQLREAWRLTGIALQQGRQLASFSERQGERRLLLEVGMVLADEWRLERIGGDHVLLSDGTGEVQLPLRELVAAEGPADASAQKQNKRQKPRKPQAPTQPAAQTTPPVDTPAPAVPAQ